MATQPRKKLADILKDADAFRSDWAGTAPAADTSRPLPAGEYVCDLTDGRLGASRNDTPYYKVELRVREVAHAARRVWHDYYLTPKALPYSMAALGKIGITHPDQLDGPPSAGLVVRARVVVKRLDSGAEFNELKSWELVEIGPTPPPAPWAVAPDAPDAEDAKGDAGIAAGEGGAP